MERVSLTYFVDFVMKAGTPKVSIVRDFRERDTYQPFADFYKNVREAIIEAHKGEAPKKALDRFVLSVKEEKRRKVYPSVIKGHKAFLGRRSVTWFQPPAGSLTIGGMEINVNPELGLIIDDVPHVIKLYFKEGRLVSNRVGAVVQLMTAALAPASPSSVFGLLDVRHSKLHVLRAPNPALSALLVGEAASFAAMYAATDGPRTPAKSGLEQAAPANVVSISVPYRPQEPRAAIGA